MFSKLLIINIFTEIFQFRLGRIDGILELLIDTIQDHVEHQTVEEPDESITTGGAFALRWTRTHHRGGGTRLNVAHSKDVEELIGRHLEQQSSPSDVIHLIRRPTRLFQRLETDVAQVENSCQEIPQILGYTTQIQLR